MNRQRHSLITGWIVLGGLILVLAYGVAITAWQIQGANPQSGIPPEIAALHPPSGTQLTIESRDITLLKGGALSIVLFVTKASGGGKQNAPDSLAVLYLIKRPGRPARDPSQPPSILALWQESLSTLQQLHKATGARVITQAGALEDASGGVAAFDWFTSKDGKSATAVGRLPILFTGMSSLSDQREYLARLSKPGLRDLQPELLGLVATSGGVPVSNFIWVPLAFNLYAEPASRYSVDTVAPYDPPARKSSGAPTPSVAAAQLLSQGAPPPGMATHAMGANGVRFSPDGKLLASWSTNDGEVKLWEVPAGNLRATLREDSVEAVAFSPDGSLLFSGGYDKSVTVRTLPDARFKARLMGFNGTLVGVTHLAATPGGLLLVTEGQSEAFAIFSLPDLKWRATLTSGGDMVDHATISPDGKFLVSSWTDNTVRLFSVPAGKLLNTFADKAFPTAISPDGSLLAYVSGGLLTVRAMPAGQVVAQRKLQGKDAQAMGQKIAFSPDGRLLGIADHAKVIEIFAAPDWQSQALLVDESCALYDWDLAFSPDGKMLASAGDKGLVTLWELNGEKRRWGLVDPAVVKK